MSRLDEGSSVRRGRCGLRDSRLPAMATPLPPSPPTPAPLPASMTPGKLRSCTQIRTCVRSCARLRRATGAVSPRHTAMPRRTASAALHVPRMPERWSGSVTVVGSQYGDTGGTTPWRQGVGALEAHQAWTISLWRVSRRTARYGRVVRRRPGGGSVLRPQERSSGCVRRRTQSRGPAGDVRQSVAVRIGLPKPLSNPPQIPIMSSISKLDGLSYKPVV